MKNSLMTLSLAVLCTCCTPAFCMFAIANKERPTDLPYTDLPHLKKKGSLKSDIKILDEKTDKLKKDVDKLNVEVDNIKKQSGMKK